jgi:hypothetical protein
MKKTNRLILLLSLLLVGLSLTYCGSSKSSNSKFVFEKNPPFKIEDAFFQRWAAGIKEGGSGINISILLKEMQPDIAVQNIYFRSHILEAKNAPNNSNTFTANLVHGSSAKGVIMDSDSMKEAQNTPYDEFPFELKDNEAVISYWFDGKRNYFKIHNLSEKQEIAYPQAPPHN